MEIEVVLELRNVFGGDGFDRVVAVEKSKLSRTKRTRQVKTSVGVAVEDEVSQETTSSELETVHSFHREGDAYFLRLGGAHGKLWGAIRNAAQKLRSFGDRDFTSYLPVVESIFVSPDMVELKPSVGAAVVVRSMPQILAGSGGKRMIVDKFDVITRCAATVRVSFPPEIRKKVERLLNALQTGSHLNKRRTSIALRSISVVESDSTQNYVRIEEAVRLK